MLAPVAWGTTYVTITELLPDGRPLLVALLRVVPAGLVLVATGWLGRRWFPRHLSEWRELAVLAMFNFAFFFPLLIVGVYRLPGGVAAAIGGTQPLLVAALSWATTRRRPRSIDLLVGAVAATGVALVVLRRDAGIDPVGVLAAIGANVSFACGVVATKVFPAPPDRVAATGYQLLLSAVAIAPLTFAIEGAPPQLEARHLVGFTYLSLIATGAAFVIWFDGVRHLPIHAPPVLGLAAPCTGVVLGWVLLGEALSPTQVLGFAITIGAITYAATIGSHSTGEVSCTRVVPAGGAGQAVGHESDRPAVRARGGTSRGRTGLS
jgi:probable blue pigment (indigoidine) exporter